MSNFLVNLMERYTPNLLIYWDDFIVSIVETLQMLFGSGSLLLSSDYF